MYQLPTKSDRRYTGNYPGRVHSLGYSNSFSQQIIGAFLSINYPVHIETNDGRRFIASRNEVSMEILHCNVELIDALKRPVTAVEELSQERYDKMIELVREAREPRLVS